MDDVFMALANRLNIDDIANGYTQVVDDYDATTAEFQGTFETYNEQYQHIAQNCRDAKGNYVDLINNMIEMIGESVRKLEEPQGRIHLLNYLKENSDEAENFENLVSEGNPKPILVCQPKSETSDVGHIKRRD